MSPNKNRTDIAGITFFIVDCRRRACSSVHCLLKMKYVILTAKPLYLFLLVKTLSKLIRKRKGK